MRVSWTNADGTKSSLTLPNVEQVEVHLKYEEEGNIPVELEVHVSTLAVSVAEIRPDFSEVVIGMIDYQQALEEEE